VLVRATRTHSLAGCADASRKVFKSEGARGLFVGFSASMMTHIPCSALSWPVYEYSRKLLYRHVYWPWLERTRGARAGETHHEGARDADACLVVTPTAAGSHVVNLTAGTIAGVCTGGDDCCARRVVMRNRRVAQCC
jgi:hypothetical protein